MSIHSKIMLQDIPINIRDSSLSKSMLPSVYYLYIRSGIMPRLNTHNTFQMTFYIPIFHLVIKTPIFHVTLHIHRIKRLQRDGSSGIGDKIIEKTKELAHHFSFNKSHDIYPYVRNQLDSDDLRRVIPLVQTAEITASVSQC